MKHAVIDADGALTGVAYDAVTPLIIAHHARFGQSLRAVADLVAEPTGGWREIPAAVAELRSTWTASRFQLREACARAGLLDALDRAADEAEDATVRRVWAEAAEIPRLSPSLATLAAVAGLSEAQVDDLFRDATTITA